MIFEKALNKILRRTELNVALAGAMLGSVTAISKLFPVMEHFSLLRVTLDNGAWRQWECVSTERLLNPWRDFLRWYHGRPQSSAYVMRLRDGADMIRREDIRAYSIRHGEREQKVSE